jgi:hypothetical protein
VPSVELTANAVEKIDALIESHGLPADTLARVLGSLEPLEHFPLAGRALHGRWEGFRLVIGPWPWMLLVYVYIETDDRVVIVTAQDARRASSATSLEP